MFVFAALGEFVVVKVLDKQYQMNKTKAQESMPRIIPVVNIFFLINLLEISMNALKTYQIIDYQVRNME